MKITTTILAVILAVTTNLSAQDLEKCETIVEKVVQAVNKEDASILMPHLATNFKMAGQTGTIAKQVLKQFLPQFNETVNSHTKVSEEKNEDELTLVYTMDYETKGEREAKFIFNADNQLKEMHLIKMKVDVKVKGMEDLDEITNGKLD
jgi:hypothetical protein